MLGVHNHYKFLPSDQQGRADGLFKIGYLAVIYDATLDEKFIKKKDQQIDNYCNQLKKGSLDYRGDTITFRDCQKRVWIITRGETQHLWNDDEIAVKEINVQAILDINNKRISQNLNEDQLARELSDLGEEDKGAFLIE